LGPMLTGILLKRSEYLKTWNARQITLIPRCNGNAAFLFWRARQRKCYFLLDGSSSASIVGEVLVLKNVERSVWFRSSVGELPIREWLDAIETARVLVDVASAFAHHIPSFVPFEVPFDLSYVTHDAPLQLDTPGIFAEDPVQDRTARAPLQQTDLSENIAATPLRPQSAQGGSSAPRAPERAQGRTSALSYLFFDPMSKALLYSFNSELARGWTAWTWRWEDLKAERELMRRGLGHLLRRELARGCTAWVWRWEYLSAMRELMRKGLSHLLNRSLSRGFGTWIEMAAERALLLQLLRKGATFMSPSKLARGWTAWIWRWLAVERELRRRSLGHDLRRVLARALTAWLWNREQKHLT